MINDLLLRCLATGLFVLSGFTYAVATVAQRRHWISVVGTGLHLAMAIAMAVMVWPWGTLAPASGLAVFFLLATVWFATLTVVWGRTIGQWVTGTYHALMMFAMTWMYAVMGGHMLPGGSAPHHPMTASMPGMDMSEMAMPTDSTRQGWVDAVNWIWLVVFTVAALVWAAKFLDGRHIGGPYRGHDFLARTAPVSMALAMAIAFAALVFGG